ncbi:MAG TPA: transglycosylase [Xanthobacteraceae bacterium]|jgi:hypothetical protein
MKILEFGCILVAMTIAYPVSQGEPLPVPENEVAPLPERAPAGTLNEKQAKLGEDYFYSPGPLPDAPTPLTVSPGPPPDAPEPLTVSPEPPPDAPKPLTVSPGPPPEKQDFSYLAYNAYSEVPPDKKPADVVLASLANVPIGTPLEEIKRASGAFGLDFTFMRTVAKIESDFDPLERTGSYIGLFQLSNSEFEKYGSGEITNPRDNAIAAAYKFATEGILFELDTHKKPTSADLYLIHQQGWQGAAEHMSHPDRIAWKSMCATDEGSVKGEKWCKRAIWENTLPSVKRLWKSVDSLTSGAFVDMWKQRVDFLYSRYSQAILPK